MSLVPVLDTLEADRLILRNRRVDEAAIYRQLWTERDPRVPPHRRIDPEGGPTVEDIAAQIRAELEEAGPREARVPRNGPGGARRCLRRQPANRARVLSGARWWIPYGTAPSGRQQLPKVSRSSLVDGRILVENPVFKDRRDVAGGGRPR